LQKQNVLNFFDLLVMRQRARDTWQMDCVVCRDSKDLFMWKEHLHSSTVAYNALHVYELSVLIQSLYKARFANLETGIPLKTSVFKPLIVKSTGNDSEPQIILKHSLSSVTQVK
jgi:hypothetical protein